MYKRAIKHWKLRKNGSHELYRAAAEAAKKSINAGGEPPDTIDGQHIHWDRVVRHFKHDPRYGTILVKYFGTNHSRSSAHRPALAPSIAGANSLEARLSHLKHYYRSRLASTGRRGVLFQQSGTAERRVPPSTLWENMLGGMYLFSRGTSHDWYPLINKACEIAPDVLRVDSTEHPELISDLVHGLSLREWDNIPALHSQILKYLTSLASSLLGNEHPITLVLTMIQARSPDQPPPDLLLTILIDAAKDEQRNERALVLLWRLEGRLASLHMSSKNWSEATRLSQKDIIQRRQLVGDRHYLTRAAIRRQAAIMAANGRYAEAEQEFLVMLKKGSAMEMQRDLRDIDVFAANDLGRLYLAQGDNDQTIAWLRRAVAWALELWGKSHHLLGCLQRDLEQGIRRMLRTQEQNMLRCEPDEKDSLPLELGDGVSDGQLEQSFHLDWSHWTLDQTEKTESSQFWKV